MVRTDNKISLMINNMYIGNAVEDILAYDIRKIGGEPGGGDCSCDRIMIGDGNSITDDRLSG